jgi:hypothetical protein
MIKNCKTHTNNMIDMNIKSLFHTIKNGLITLVYFVDEGYICVNAEMFQL